MALKFRIIGSKFRKSKTIFLWESRPVLPSSLLNKLRKRRYLEYIANIEIHENAFNISAIGELMLSFEATNPIFYPKMYKYKKIVLNTHLFTKFSLHFKEHVHSQTRHIGKRHLSTFVFRKLFHLLYSQKMTEFKLFKN